MGHAQGELDAYQVHALLKAQHVGRLTCHCRDGARALPVRYTVCDSGRICIQMSDHVCPELAREKASVRFEVDAIESPLQWSTLIGWGFVEETAATTANGTTCRVRFTGLRGFYRDARPAAAR